MGNEDMMDKYECTCTKNTDGSIGVDPACPEHGSNANKSWIPIIPHVDSDVVYNPHVVYKIQCDALDRIADTLGDILRLMERAEK
jgi:hypothetical protein